VKDTFKREVEIRTRKKDIPSSGSTGWSKRKNSNLSRDGGKEAKHKRERFMESSWKGGDPGGDVGGGGGKVWKERKT